jgi:hypothetical protein
MGLDLAVVALLTGVSGLWLLGGLALVVLQLRSRGGLPSRLGKRAWVGWAGAALIGLLALDEAGSQWQAWRHPETPSVTAPARQAAAEDADDSASSPTGTLNDRARIAQLEAELAEARKPKRWREQLTDGLDEAGAGLGWGIVYFSLLPAWWGGQTVGKKLLGLRVVELTGKPMTVMRCLKRYGGYAAGLATGGIGLAQVVWDINRQGLQDKAAHTVVVDLRAAPANAYGSAGTAPDQEP